MNPIDEKNQKQGIIIVAENTFVVFGWSMLAYFLIRLITAFLWFFTGRLYKINLLENEVVGVTINTFSLIIVLVIVTFFVAWLWLVYNYKRFAHLNRRKFSLDVTESELVNWFGIPASIIKGIRTEQITTIEINDGRIINVLFENNRSQNIVLEEVAITKD